MLGNSIQKQEDSNGLSLLVFVFAISCVSLLALGCQSCLNPLDPFVWIPALNQERGVQSLQTRLATAQ